MNDLLPWRIAAFAGLLVGGISLAHGVSLWPTFIRVGAAFFSFAVLGMLLRTLLSQEKTASNDTDHRGRHVDETTSDTRFDNYSSMHDESGLDHQGDMKE